MKMLFQFWQKGRNEDMENNKLNDFELKLMKRIDTLEKKYDEEIEKLKSEVMSLRAYNELFKNNYEDTKGRINWNSYSINSNKANTANQMSKDESISLNELLIKIHDIIKDVCINKGSKHVYIYFGRKVEGYYSIEELDWNSNTTKLDYIIAILKDEGFKVECLNFDRALRIIWDKEGEGK